MIFTDLDGTLLDHHSYLASDRAVALLEELSSRDIVVVPVTSKTASEVRPLTAKLGLGPMAIVEGGAVVLDDCGRKVLLGGSRRELVAVLETLKRAGYPLQGMSEMSAAEVAGLTGLRPPAAARAMDRSASEPFASLRDLGPGEEVRLAAIAEANGAQIARGGRFRHLHSSGIDKGAAVRRILDRSFPGCRKQSAAVGDAWNDLPMLAEVELGFLLGDAVEAHLVPEHVTRLPMMGPAGFVEAMRRALAVWGARLEE